MSDTQRTAIIRFALVFLGILLFALCIVARIIYLQTSPKQRRRAEQVLAWQVKANCPIAPIRGNITDYEGRLLASSMPLYNVYMDTRVKPLHKKNGSLYLSKADSVAYGLSTITGAMNAQDYRRRMDKAFYAKEEKERDFRLCPNSVNYIQKKQIEQLPLIKLGRYTSGVYFTNQHSRNHPYGDLGSRTIGSVFGNNGTGYSGLEKYFDDYLSGEEGLATRQMVAGSWEDVPVKEAVNGCNIITTLDANLLDICDHALRQRLQHTNADWGCCILMETSTGAIKAVCNLDRKKDGQYEEKHNHAVIRVEPGSTFKTISLMAVLDDGKMDIDDTIHVNKEWNYRGSKHRDSHPKDTVYTLKNGLAISSNIVFAKMVTRSYEKKAQKFVNKLQSMGICTDFATEIPGATPPRIDVPKDEVTLSKMSYGYSVELSPMQIIAFYNSIANDGKMVRPRLIARIEDEDGEIVKKWHPEILDSHICKQSVLKDVRSALHDVVWDNKLGTASVTPWKTPKAQSEIVKIAGKTGTAQMLVNGKYRSNQHRMTFVGYFPEENPQYTCLCMICHPKNIGYDAGMDCGSVVRQIAEQTMAYTGEYLWENGQWVWRKR